jgi:hypothetical protein
MTVLQIIVAVFIFAVALWLINNYVAPSLFKNILIGVVIVLALVVLLSGFGLMNLLNAPVLGSGGAHIGTVPPR